MQSEKGEPNMTHLTVAGGDTYYPDDVATQMGSLKIIKLIVKSLLSQPRAWCVCFATKSCCLDTHLEYLEYVCTKVTDIQLTFVDE